MAVRCDAGNNHAPVFLRSYKNSQELSLLPDIKLWEAARATSAAPAYFAPIKVGNYELVDGGLQANNPLGWYVAVCLMKLICSQSITNVSVSVPLGSGLKFLVSSGLLERPIAF